jgi:hypothetical protein
MRREPMTPSKGDLLFASGMCFLVAVIILVPIFFPALLDRDARLTQALTQYHKSLLGQRPADNELLAPTQTLHDQLREEAIREIDLYGGLSYSLLADLVKAGKQQADTQSQKQAPRAPTGIRPTAGSRAI